jgi:hypothetical protein
MVMELMHSARSRDHWRALQLHQGRWAVYRDGGTARGMRVVRHCRNEREARQLMDKVKREMRQGCALLIDPHHNLVDYASEPMCRTRW